MDRMNFVPGATQREAIEKTGGHIFFDRRTALDFADEFLSQHPLLYQTALASLANGDRVDIRFGLRDAKPEEEVPSGELIGHTWATLTEASGKEKLLWEVGRGTNGIREIDAVRAFNAFRAKMAEYKGVQMPEPLAEVTDEKESDRGVGGPPRISRALSPSHLYNASGILWYFVDLSMTAPTSAEHLSTPLQLSRPMNAFDTLILGALLTLVYGAPPLVFGVFMGVRTGGAIPTKLLRTDYLFGMGNLKDVEEAIIVG